MLFVYHGKIKKMKTQNASRQRRKIEKREVKKYKSSMDVAAQDFAAEARIRK